MSKNLVVCGNIKDNYFKNNKNIYALGEWCLIKNKIYNYKLRKRIKVLKYHWEDKKKLGKDYVYLNNLFEKILKELSDSLNNFHNFKKSNMYWRILLSPWLMDYIATMYDRWSLLDKRIVNNFSSITMLEYKYKKNRILDYSDFLKASYDDVWNSKILHDIIKYKKIKKKVYFLKPFREKKKHKFSLHLYFLSSLNFFLKRSIYKLIGLLINKKIIVKSMNFKLSSYLYFSLSNKKFIFDNLFFNIFLDHKFKNKKVNKKKIQLNYKCKNDFENYLVSKIVSDIPLAYTDNLRFFIKNLPNYIPDKIFTANDHYWNEFFKIFMAECYLKNTKIYITEHGGSILSKHRIFDFEEKISFKKLTWCKPFQKNQIQIQSPKYININKNSKKLKKRILILFSSFNTYTQRCRCGPMASKWKKDFDQKFNLLREIINDSEISNNIQISVRPGKEGWGNKELITTNFKKDIISKYENSLDDIKNSDLVICPYPETSFSDCVMTGTPALLLYRKSDWQFKGQFLELVKNFEKNNLLFYDYNSAFNHIKKITHNPYKWWNLKNIKKSIKNFNKICCQENSDWKKDWLKILE